MKNLIALLVLVSMVAVVVAQDLDAPKTGAAQAQQQQQQQGGGSLFDQLMAKLSAQQAQIAADRVQYWAFNDSYGWIWQVATHNYNAQYVTYLGGDRAAQIAEAQAIEAQLSPAEYAAFRQAATQTWMQLEAQGLN